MKKLVWLFSLVLVWGLVACDGNQPKPVTNDDAEVNAAGGEVRPAQPGGGTPAGGASTPAPPRQVEKPDALVELEKKYDANPQDADSRTKLVQATYEFGKKVNYDPELMPRVKYPQALRLFRRVLELDPSHEQAKAEKEQIESIYRSMGRPIPE
jgi:hypothetical protein